MKKTRIVLLCACLVLFACVPTPEEEAVVNKGDNLAEQRILATTVPHVAEQTSAPTVFPTRWQDRVDLEKGFMRLVVDAEIVTSGQATFPVRRVKGVDFTAEQVRAVAEKMIPRVEAYRDGRVEYTMQDYERHLAALLEKGLEEPFEIMYNQMKASNPPDADEVFIEADRLNIDSPNCCQVVAIDRARDRYAHIMSTPKWMLIHTRFDTYFHLKDTVERYGSYDGEEPVTVNAPITLEQATETAHRFLEELGLEGFAVAFSIEARYFDTILYEEVNQGWLLSLVRPYEYYPVDLTYQDGFEGGIFEFEESAYRAAMDRENIKMYISEEGVEVFQWTDPMETIGIVNENVELMPIEEMQKRILKTLTFGLGWTQDKQYEKRPFFAVPYLTKMVLTTTIQPVKDDPTGYWLMPVWACMIELRSIDFADGTVGDAVVSREVCAFNALDGSRARLSAGE